jgi:hypothetical protein
VASLLFTDPRQGVGIPLASSAIPVRESPAMATTSVSLASRRTPPQFEPSGGGALHHQCIQKGHSITNVHTDRGVPDEEDQFGMDPAGGSHDVESVKSAMMRITCSMKCQIKLCFLTLPLSIRFCMLRCYCRLSREIQFCVRSCQHDAS